MLNIYVPLILVSFFFSSIICTISSSLENVVTFLYIVSLYILSKRFYLYCLAFNSRKQIQNIILLNLSIYGPILFAFYLCTGEDNLLWMHDSYDYHLVKVMEFSNRFLGTNYEVKLHHPGMVLSSHFVVALFFKVLGMNPIVSSVVTSLAKVLTVVSVYLMSSKIFQIKRVALLSALLFSIFPSGIFYSLTFYKESFVQLWIALFFLAYSSLKESEFSLKKLIIIIPLGLLSLERYYIAFFCFPLLVPYFLVFEKKYLKKNLFLILMIILFVGVFFSLFVKHLVFITDFFSFIEKFRNDYLSLEDIDQTFNKDIPYLFGVVKIILTPFFTFKKIGLFKDYSTLITLGSFIHHIFTLLLALTLYSFYKMKKYRDKFIYFIPYFIYILFAGYVSPYNGRYITSK